MSGLWKFVAVCFVIVALSFSGMTSFAADYEYKLRMSQVMPSDSDHHERCEAFAQEVKEKTDGRIQIQIYSGGVLGDWVDVHEYVMRGDVDMALQPLAPTYDPRLNIGYYMPYMFTTNEQAKEAYQVDGWVYNMVGELLMEQDIKGLALYPVGWAGVSTKKEPDGWEEMKRNKMKIRVMPLKACALTWEALGYIPSTIPYNETYSAIERGVADGQSGGPPFQAYQMRDVQNVWIQYNDYLEPWWFFINLDLWNNLIEEDQQVLINAAQKQVEGRWDYFLQEDELYRQKLRDAGMKVIVPTEEQLERFAHKVRTEVWVELESLLGKALVDRCRENVGMEVE
ncbi:MAG: TRAP transporter substrate-binding protein DctP [Desulfovermiculus sp.]|nr:TRAP transporter substrate-binding protein DctP [Desulfovermiculus sp.]